MSLAKKYKNDISILTNKIAVDLLIKENKPVLFRVDEKFQYSNTNYILLARIAEIITGKSFEAFMKEELFTPLEMHNTRVWNLISREPFKNKAEDLENFNGDLKHIEPSYIDGVAGDGAVFSSISDMLKWDHFWYENKLIPKENLQEAFKRPILNNGNQSDYGFGWIITKDGMWHNGSWLGARTIIIRNTEQKKCLVVLDNSSNLSFDKILKELTSSFPQK